MNNQPELYQSRTDLIRIRVKGPCCIPWQMAPDEYCSKMNLAYVKAKAT